MTGAFLRVKRNGKFESIEVEFLTNEERQQLLSQRSPDELLRWLDLTCNKLAQLEPLLKSLEDEGIIEIAGRDES